jgi:hypothetical protein
MNIALSLERGARLHPDRMAIFRGGAAWASYGQLAARVGRLPPGCAADWAWHAQTAWRW